MKPQRFKPGQEVTVIENKGWTLVAGPPRLIKPQYGKIYTVSRYSQVINNDWYIMLVEFGLDRDFNENRFAPIISDSILEKELSEITITETV